MLVLLHTCKKKGIFLNILKIKLRRLRKKEVRERDPLFWITSRKMRI